MANPTNTTAANCTWNLIPLTILPTISLTYTYSIPFLSIWMVIKESRRLRLKKVSERMLRMRIGVVEEEVWRKSEKKPWSPACQKM